MATLPTPRDQAQPRALLYDRVSTLTQARTGYSGGAEGFQLDLCRAHSERKGYAVIGHKTDVDSGAKWDVAGLIGAIEMAKRGEFDVLVVADSGRFARSLAKKLVYEGDLRRHGVRVEYTNLPVDDTAEGRLVANMFGAYDEYEREKIAWRLGNGRLNKAKRGQYIGNGGRAPYGYRLTRRFDQAKQRYFVVGLEEDSESADVVRRVFREALTLSATDIALRLTAAAIPTATGRGRWSSISVYHVLVNPTYKGEALYSRGGNRFRPREGEGIAIPVPALVSPSEWDAVQAAMTDRRSARRGRQPAESDPFELRGLLHCHHCGGLLSTGEYGPRYYLCLRHDASHARKNGWQPCPLPIVNAEAIEREVWRCVVEALEDPDRLRRGMEEHRASSGSAARQAWQDRIDVLDAELAKHTRLLANAAREKLPLDTDDPRYEQWDQLEAQEARTLKRLREERATLVGRADALALSEQQLATLERFAAKVRKGARKATPADRREFYRSLLRLKATLRLDREHGVKIGRKGRFAIAWDSLVPLTDSASGTLKVQALSVEEGTVILSVRHAAA